MPLTESTLRMAARQVFGTEMRQMHAASRRAPAFVASPQCVRTVSTTSRVTTTGTRSIHATATPKADSIDIHQFEVKAHSETMPPSVLSVLPLTNILRSWAVNTLSSSKWMLPPSLAIMSILAHTTNPILNPDRNPILGKLIKSTFYAQFCAGENEREVKRTMKQLKKEIGYTGVILGYAREIVLPKDQLGSLVAAFESPDCESIENDCLETEIKPWAEGTLETVRMAEPGDFVALKFTGAGRQALYLLSKQLPPSGPMAQVIDEICDLAIAKGVRLLFDAEQNAIQAGIDDWTMACMRKYNTKSAVIYNTYQSYLKSTPSTLATHLKAAKEGDFILGAKQVRGAYMGSDPRHLIHDSKADTDECYDGVASALLRQQWTGPLAEFAPADRSFPQVALVLASHNAETVHKAQEILERGQAKSPVAFGTLQGMADEVSCELVVAKQAAASQSDESSRPQPYKYLVWGSTGECMKYLLRRAQENRDAVQRTRSGRDAMQAELWRRLKSVFRPA